ncbi:hypothetical protein BD779DRAFT_1563330 [Infundibulicybe gibba]|nr:hypothetical protein BD779DRAFT_1563330 [Infundibulicybe gibba]
MSQEFINNAVLGSHTFSDPSVVGVTASLSGENRRDIMNTIEFASRNAYALAPEGQSWEWFHDFTSAIAKLGWTMQTPGPEDVDLGRTPGTSAIGKLVTTIAKSMRIAIEVNEGGISIPTRRQLAQDPGLFDQSSASANRRSFSVGDARCAPHSLLLLTS